MKLRVFEELITSSSVEGVAFTLEAQGGNRFPGKKFDIRFIKL